MQKPNKLYSAVRKNQKWVERRRRQFQAFHITMIILGTVALIWHYGKEWLSR